MEGDDKRKDESMAEMKEVKIKTEYGGVVGVSTNRLLNSHVILDAYDNDDRPLTYWFTTDQAFDLIQALLKAVSVIEGDYDEVEVGEG